MLPSIKELLVEVPLYNDFQLNSDNANTIIEMFSFSEKLDAFCPACGKLSTFEGYGNIPTVSKDSEVYAGWTFRDIESRTPQGVPMEVLLGEIRHVKLRCTRVTHHLMVSSFYIDVHGRIEKVGQYPSLAQLTLPELRKYQSILSKEKYKELNRGIGLTTHGVGIGAFVYLRRVFEDLIEEAHQIEKLESHWDEEVYSRSRMKEKIQLLQHALPTFLVDNNTMYSILSKGIHELSEKDCLDFFPAMKLSVELILDEKLERYRKQKKIEEAQASIAKIQAQLANE